ncbi:MULTISPECIES: hypothetical protein [unclassified Chromobacterium]|uniref:hypothetical protein n=1 Tax=unclassified Chromobacterium TaxID=2641838 RepID=UPI001F1CF1CD|nr:MULTISPECIES: hypothetical protein [unclassified Chromobacterium]MCP1291129.1 hypothetical protein [Chromobacterium sp. S0633]UJB32664.1 hypothetical protein HQN78_17360 [Chromobacterium sp. Beijing]
MNIAGGAGLKSAPIDVKAGCAAIMAQLLRTVSSAATRRAVPGAALTFSEAVHSLPRAGEMDRNGR